MIGVTNTVEILNYNELQDRHTVESLDTAKKLCKIRTFISTSHKCFTLGITLELLHIYLHSSYRILELAYIALDNSK